MDDHHIIIQGSYNMYTIIIQGYYYIIISLSLSIYIYILYICYNTQVDIYIYIYTCIYIYIERERDITIYVYIYTCRIPRLLRHVEEAAQLAEVAADPELLAGLLCYSTV